MDRFIDAMIQIRKEIAEVESGNIDAENNPLKHAPHTLADMLDENWERPYSKLQAAYPNQSGQTAVSNKYWPSVNRIDNVYGDRNLFCACPSIESYE